MTREELLARREYFNMVHGVTIRAIATLIGPRTGFPADGRVRVRRAS